MYKWLFVGLWLLTAPAALWAQEKTEEKAPPSNQAAVVTDAQGISAQAVYVVNTWSPGVQLAILVLFASLLGLILFQLMLLRSVLEKTAPPKM